MDDLWLAYEKACDEKSDMWKAVWRNKIEVRAAEDAVDHYILSEARERLKGKDWRKESKPID